MLRAFRIPLTSTELAKRTVSEVLADNCLGLAAQLAFADDKAGGLLALGMLGTLWSTSSGVTAIIDTLNQAYDIQESRPWWKVKVLALGLTIVRRLAPWRSARGPTPQRPAR